MSITPLPGLDEIQSSFDAVKMLNGQEQNKITRLFNLEDLSTSTNYTCNVLNSDHTYSIPSLVQITDINFRVENYGSIVASTFKDFCLKYVFFIYIL